MTTSTCEIVDVCRLELTNTKKIALRREKEFAPLFPSGKRAKAEEHFGFFSERLVRGVGCREFR